MGEIVGDTIACDLPYIDVTLKSRTVRVYDFVNGQGRKVQIVRSPCHVGLARCIRDPEFVEQLNLMNQARGYEEQ